MSGHSKWATIKHKKGAADAKRGKLFAKLIRQLEIAARSGGGDMDANPTLRTMFQKARAASVPVDTIERAIQRGTGELEGVTSMPAVFDQRWVSKLDGIRVKDGANKYDLAQQLVEDIARFKAEENCDRLVMVWTGSTEAYQVQSDVHADRNSTKIKNAHRLKCERIVP